MPGTLMPREVSPTGERRPGPPRWVAPALGVAVLAGLYAARLHGYLLFHGLAEALSIALGAGIFIIAWNVRRVIDNGYLLFLGLGIPFISILDLVHTLAYKGMGVFPGHGADLPTQLWIAARVVQAASFLLAPLYLTRWPRTGRVLFGYFVVTAALLGLVFSGEFPRCFDEETGLTPFKTAAEYAISSVLAASAVILWRRRRLLDRSVLSLILWALAAFILSELAFTRYQDVYGWYNMAGHYLKLIGAFLVYKGLVETGLSRPLGLLFTNLKRSKDQLREENDRLTALQAELAGANERLWALNEEKNRILGIAAHDIRNPLAVIRIYADMLADRLEGTGGEEAAGLLSVIRNKSTFGLKLINRTLDISAIDAGRLDLDCQLWNLGELAEEVLVPARFTADRAGVRVTFVDEGVPAVPVDRIRFEEVLDNLLSNAVKFSPEGGTVEVRLRRVGGDAVVSVSDQGEGIPPGDVKRLFRPFESITPGSRGERGTGLGLAIVRKVVERHGGRIWVETGTGRGSTFFASFPLAPPATA